MKRFLGTGVAVFGVILVGWFWWKAGQPRREAFAALEQLNVALCQGFSTQSVDLVILPQALAARTVPERTEFIRKALQGEISTNGLLELRRQGRFGPLQQVFPTEAEQWASMAGVAPAECVAFRLDRTNGFRAEVVLYQTTSTYRIVRCNNVTPTDPEAARSSTPSQ